MKIPAEQQLQQHRTGFGAASGNLHLRSSVPGVASCPRRLEQVPADIDGHERTERCYVGADEMDSRCHSVASRRAQQPGNEDQQSPKPCISNR